MSSNRDINELDPGFKEKVMKFLSHAHHAGYSIFITEGYRSQERQNELYAQGRTTSGNVVTWTLNSVHTQRKGIDIAWNSPELYPSDLNLWKEVGKIAAMYEIDWGYDLWGKDLPHFQDNGIPLDTSQEFNSYKTDERKASFLLEMSTLNLPYKINWKNLADAWLGNTAWPEKTPQSGNEEDQEAWWEKEKTVNEKI